MNPTRTTLALFVLAAVANATLFNTINSLRNNRGNSLVGIRPFAESGVVRGIDRTDNALNGWLNKISENIPSLDSISYDNLIHMPVTTASTLLETVFMNSYLRPSTESLFNPNENELKMYLIRANGNISMPVKNPSALKQYPQLSSGEVTILITGLPSNCEDPSDAIAELVEAYRVRYQLSDVSAEYTRSNALDSPATGNLIVVDLGNCLTTFKKWATLDVKEVGKTVGQTIVDISSIVPYFNIHLIGHSVGAHVAGVAARYFSEVEGKELRHVTGLDPSKLYSKKQQIQSQLNRGVASFVDVIHSTSYGAGDECNGDVDFYPNGPGSLPNSDNVFDASLEPVRYYAESVLPGNENNFMAVECNSMEDYENQHCYGVRIPMGYTTPMHVKGNFILRVNSNAPYGRNGRRLSNNRNRSSFYQ